MKIQIANDDQSINACYAVMKELREDLTQEDFFEKVKRLQKTGWMLAYLKVEGGVKAVAGFRQSENLAWGTYIYVDDLVTLGSERSKGYGKAMLDYLKNYAQAQGCYSFHLDSGVQRKAAHKFYERENMTATSLHFACLVD